MRELPWQTENASAWREIMWAPYSVPVRSYCSHSNGADHRANSLFVLITSSI